MKSKGNKYSKVIIYWLFNSSHYCPCSQGTSMVSMCGCNNSLFKAKVITLVVWNWPWWKSLYHEYCQLYKYSSFFFFLREPCVEYLPAHHWHKVTVFWHRVFTEFIQSSYCTLALLKRLSPIVLVHYLSLITQQSRLFKL
jgi:hypothetical protein